MLVSKESILLFTFLCRPISQSLKYGSRRLEQGDVQVNPFMRLKHEGLSPNPTSSNQIIPPNSGRHMIFQSLCKSKSLACHLSTVTHFSRVGLCSTKDLFGMTYISLAQLHQILLKVYLNKSLSTYLLQMKVFTVYHITREKARCKNGYA